MKTRDVRREPGQYGSCNVGLRFWTADDERVLVQGYPVVGTHPLLGTNAWAEVSRVLQVPAGAARAETLCFLSMSGVAWFDDIAVTVLDEPEWIAEEGEHFTFHHFAGDEVPDWARSQNEKNLAELEKRLGLKLRERISFFKYPDLETKTALTGRGGNAHVGVGSSLHTIWRVDRHEMVHLLLRQIGDPESILLGEGIAVWLAGDWQGASPDEHVRELAASGRLPALPELVEYESFLAVGDAVAYPTAGSFVGFLLGLKGMETLKSAYPMRGNRMDAARFRARLAEVYGQPVEDLERVWLASLDLGE